MTQDELELARKELKLVKDKYYENHSRCPECGGNDYWTTLVGYIMKHGHEDEFRDGNDVSCKCGWKGSVHDLKAKG